MARERGEATAGRAGAVRAEARGHASQERWWEPVRMAWAAHDQQVLRRPEHLKSHAEHAVAHRLQMVPPPEGMADPPALVRMSGVFATEQTYLTMMVGRSDEGYLQLRFTQARLTLAPGMVRAGVDTPAGVPMSYEHLIGGWFSLPALGRVLSMDLEGRRLVGEYALSPSELSLWYAGGVKDMEAGLHAGLSVGFSGLEPPKLERRSGTRWDPDRMRWGRIQVFEVAVTDLPALSNAGRTGSVEDAGEGEAGGKHDKGEG